MEGNLLENENIALDTIEKEELQNVKVYLQKLYVLWRDFGMNEDQKIQRGRVVWKHLRNLLQDILDEELSFYADIKERIQSYTNKIESLSNLLSIIPKEESSISLIKKEENLRRELDNLIKLKHKRLRSYRELRSVESVYCSVLGVKEYQLSSSTSVPSENDLLEIDKHIHKLTKERDKRHKKFCLAKKELTTILEATELTPETPFEKEILSDSDSISLTDETFKALEEVVSKAQRKKAELETRKKVLLDKLSALWDRLRVPDSKRIEFLSKHVDFKLSTLNSIENELEICEKVKKENIKLYVDTLRKELKQLWGKCYASESDRKRFALYRTNELTDEVLEAHEAEVEKWKKYYEEVKPIVNKIEEREKLWNLLLVFENKASDPNRFRNRRGNLLQEEKERKKLQKDLPALENDIFHEIDLYEDTYGKPFQYYGEDFRAFVTSQWQERNNQKEDVKKERHRQHLRQVENELGLDTPAKRPLLGTPKTTPGKSVKSNNKMSVYYTPVTTKAKALPSTVEKSMTSANKCKNSVRKSGVKCKLFPSCNSHPKDEIKEHQNTIFSEQNSSKSSSSKSTTYSEFANELNSTAKHSYQSSVLSTKRVGGSRMLHNNSKGKRSKASQILRRSKRNALKTASILTPTRGKLGLPFLI